MIDTHLLKGSLVHERNQAALEALGAANPKRIALMDMDLTVTTEAVIDKSYVALGLVAGGENYYDLDARKEKTLNAAEHTRLNELVDHLRQLADKVDESTETPQSKKDLFAEMVNERGTHAPERYTENNYLLYLALLQCAQKDPSRSEYYWRSVMDRITHRVPEAYRYEPFAPLIEEEPTLNALRPLANGTMPLMSDTVLEAMGRLAARMFHIDKGREDHAQGILFPLAAYVLEHLDDEEVAPVFITATLVPFAQGFTSQIYTYLGKEPPFVIGTGCVFNDAGGVAQMEPMDKLHKLDALEAVRDILPEVSVAYAGGDKMLIRKASSADIVLKGDSPTILRIMHATGGKFRFSRDDLPTVEDLRAAVKGLKKGDLAPEVISEAQGMRTVLRPVQNGLKYTVQVPSDVFAAYADADQLVDAFQSPEAHRLNNGHVQDWERVAADLMLKAVKLEAQQAQVDSCINLIQQTLDALQERELTQTTVDDQLVLGTLAEALHTKAFRDNPSGLEARLLESIQSGGPFAVIS
ncbi:hypothetical protein GC177_05835 [bacterium]|nr:hypothetical protein [bacterium]